MAEIFIFLKKEIFFAYVVILRNVGFTKFKVQRVDTGSVGTMAAKKF
jgi:hypothetical protein